MELTVGCQIIIAIALALKNCAGWIERNVLCGHNGGVAERAEDDAVGKGHAVSRSRRRQEIGHVSRDVFGFNLDRVGRASNRCAALREENVVQGIHRPKIPHRVGDRGIALHKLAIPNLQPPRGRRRAHANVREADSQVVNVAAPGKGEIKVRPRAGVRQRPAVIVPVEKRFALRVIINAGQNAREERLRIAEQRALHHQGRIGNPVKSQHAATHELRGAVQFHRASRQEVGNSWFERIGVARALEFHEQRIARPRLDGQLRRLAQDRANAVRYAYGVAAGVVRLHKVDAVAGCSGPGNVGAVESPLVSQGPPAQSRHAKRHGVAFEHVLAQGVQYDGWPIRGIRIGMADKLFVSIGHTVAVCIVGSGEYEKTRVCREVGHNEVRFAGASAKEPKPVGEVETGDVRAQVRGHEEVVNPGGDLHLWRVNDE